MNYQVAKCKDCAKGKQCEHCRLRDRIFVAFIVVIIAGIIYNILK